VIAHSCSKAKYAMAGLSRQLAGNEACTEAGAVLGTVPYIAPEVFDSCTPTQASDVYAFGILCKNVPRRSMWV
jgi:serine/threonine protein kinase